MTDAIPYFWFAIALLGSILALVAVRRMPRGYRYPFVFLLLMILTVSAGIAATSYWLGTSRQIDGFLVDRMPGYDAMRLHHMRIWERPDHGFLGGRIRHIDIPRHILIIEGFLRESWIVHTDMVPPADLDRLEIGEPIGMIGSPLRFGEFVARGIRHAGPPR